MTSLYANHQYSIDRLIFLCVDLLIDRSHIYLHNSQKYLIPDETTKNDVLGNNVQFFLLDYIFLCLRLSKLHVTFPLNE